VEARMDILNCRKLNLIALKSWISLFSSEKDHKVNLKFVSKIEAIPIKRRKRSFDALEFGNVNQKPETRSNSGCDNCSNLKDRISFLEDQHKLDQQEIKKYQRHIGSSRDPVIIEEDFNYEFESLLDPIYGNGCIKKFSPELVKLSLYWLADVCISKAMHMNN
jgi:hypothetical protein